jgi:acyl-coenzyme A synthetase/AMP-(fatty) acid ligase
MIGDSGAAAVIYSPEFASEVEPAVAALAKKPRHVLRTEGGLDKLIAAAPASLAPHPAKPTDDCFWLYSSGSTGRPKGAVHRQRDMVVPAIDTGSRRWARARATSSSRRRNCSSPTGSATR